MRCIILFFATLFSSQFYSQSLSLTDNLLQISETIVFTENVPVPSETMGRFVNWKNKIDTVFTNSNTADTFIGNRIVLIDNSKIKYDFKFQLSNTGYTYLISNLKHIINNNETNLEDLSDLGLKSELINKLNEHFSDLIKSLKLELQDF